MPKVSILLPTYKDAPFIKGAIRSIQSQSYSNWELIIIDDGLSSVARDMVVSFAIHDARIKIVKNKKNIGIQRSLNLGIEIASGEYIARIDDDDKWLDQEKLCNQINFLKNNKEYVLIGTSAIICNEKGVVIERYFMPTGDESIRKRMLFKNCFIHSSILTRRDIIKRVGGYSEEKNNLHVEDYELWLRIGLLGKISNMGNPMVELMIHSDSLTSRNRISQSIKTLILCWNYKDKYPGFFRAVGILVFRIIGFFLSTIFPLPDKVLYKIQSVYKSM